MNDSEFIEYLNLYLDHEITAADAARLEAEVQRSPERRRIYRDYCRMQKACMLLAKDFNDEAASAAAQVRVPVEVEGARRFSWGTGVWGTAGLFAAVACVAIVFIANRNPGLVRWAVRCRIWPSRDRWCQPLPLRSKRVSFLAAVKTLQLRRVLPAP